MPHPRVFIVSGPSGVGKSSIIHGVLERRPELRLSVSTTTRPIREGERDGRDYHFADKSSFENMIGEEAFLEWAQSYDNYYGTGRHEIDGILAEGRSPLLDIDTQGVLQIQERFGGAVYIFIRPPSLADLEQRLRGRGSESEETLRKRLARAEWEIGLSGRYDYSIVNDNVENAIATFLDVVDREMEVPVKFGKLESTQGATPSQEGLARTLEADVKAALRIELEELIRERLQKVLDSELERIVEEVYLELQEG